jgi:hypothetical protein
LGISGSKAYGLATQDSDTDIKGVFILPQKNYYGLNYTAQVSDESNDIVFYELGRFIQLLSVNNPNILELLHSPEDAIIYRHPFLSEIKPDLFLSRLCRDTFGKYAFAQIKKARGLKKKILNPVARERKNLLSFCYVNFGKGSIPLLKFLEIKGWNQKNCGLVNIPHMKNIYGLYHSEKIPYKGILRKPDSTEVCLSSIPKGQKQEALLYVNREGYSTYCREYSEYWNWVANRNDSRYENTKIHGKSYDTKNMMHVFRLLQMGIEIGRENKINVKRPDREFLLDIKAGKFEYDQLLKMAEEKQKEMEASFKTSRLPEKPDIKVINQLVVQLRDKYYKSMNQSQA